MTKYLITGGAGFIGSHLIDHLLEDGVAPQDLRMIIPPWETLQNLKNKNFEIMVGDIRDKKIVKEAMKDVDVVYHLAAKTVVGGSYHDYASTNVKGTENILKEAQIQKIKKFIFFSSIAVFGLPAWSGDMKNINEHSPKEPSESYGKSKLEGERKVVQLCKKSKIPYIIIRPTTVYGSRDKAGIFQLLNVIHKGQFVFIGNAQNKMDYVYVIDLAKMARKAEKSKIQNEDFIIGEGAISTQKEIVTILHSSLHKKISSFYIPKNVALLLSYILKLFANVMNTQQILFPERVKVLTTNCYFDSSKAKRILGYNPIGIKEGLKITAMAFQEQIDTKAI